MESVRAAEQRTIVTGKETAIRRGGEDWSFGFPDAHTVYLTGDGNYVSLEVPLGGSSVFAVERIDDSDPEEVVVFLGAQHGYAGPPTFGQVETGGYPLPEIQDERERLRSRWLDAGLDEEDFNAYARGESHEDRFRSIRHTLRQRADD